MQAIHEESHGDLTLKIIPDPDASIGRDEVLGEGVVLAILHRRYANPAVGEGLDEPEDVTAREEAADANGEVWFPVYLYDHSGVTYRLGDPEDPRRNPFVGRLPQGHAEFDSGRVGSIFLKRSEFGADADLRTVAEGVVSSYSDYANGEVYGYVIEDEEGEQVDSCWGFLGYDYALEQAREALPE